MDSGSKQSLSESQVQSVRFGGERIYAHALAGVLPALQQRPDDGARVRRMLLAHSLLLSEGMAPTPYAAARQCADILGISEPIEIYQAAGAENAALHRCQTPVLLEIQGRLLSLLDDATLKALMGHELGHYLAHGSSNPYSAAAYAARRLLVSESAPDEQLELARRLSMSMELTADRFGLLACGDLEAALRLEMAVVTGLPAVDLTWDTAAYLEQSKALISGMIEEGETAIGHSHPEHSLRTYALWLFSESDLYRAVTGRGTGGRPIAEVDEQLLDILGRAEACFGNAAVFEEPQLEVQECALAACVLVAAADGEIHETEMQAIERVFAHLLANWRELLDPAEALVRFQELAPVIHASGPRAQRALFALLTHVLAADGECAEEEVDQILAIGAALGCLGLFRSLIPSVLAASTLSLDTLAEAPVRSIPMPAEARQARAALKVYFERVARRGGDTVTARRLLRLLGANRNSDAVRKELEAAANAAQLLISPSLGEDLDAVLRLEPMAGVRTPVSVSVEPVAVDPASPAARLRRAVARMRDRLVSGDGRSPSIRLRAVRAGRAFDLHQLEDVSTGLAERALQMVTESSSITVLDGAHADTHEGARRVFGALVALDRERQSRTEETGADDLYLGYPFLTGTAKGYLLRGPLILYPARIHRDRGRIALSAVADETPIANQALLRLLLRQKQLPFPEALVEECDAAAARGIKALTAILERLGIKVVDTTGHLEAFRNRNEELDGWRDDRLELEDCAVLGLFPQSNSDLLHDYDDLLSQLEAGREPSALLACAAEVMPAEIKALAQSDFVAPATSGGRPIPAIYADPVQRAVLEKARATRALVVDGPPGTGKSQVIVNLVADALLRNEKVAVVCEKRAALDVVVNRLEGLGLRHLLALVHDVHEDRRSVFQQVAARIQEPHERKRPAASLDVLDAERQQLENTVSAVSRSLCAAGSGISLGHAYVYFSGLDCPILNTEVPLAELSADEIPELADAMQSLASGADLWRPDSPWLAPAPALVRPSFESLDGPRMAEHQRVFQAAFVARKAFEEACAVAGLVIVRESLAAAVQARSGLGAVVESRPYRTEGQAQLLFSELFVAMQRSPDLGTTVADALQSVAFMEQTFTMIGLAPGSASRAILARAQLPLTSVKQALQVCDSATAKQALSAWFRNGGSASGIAGEVDRLHGEWRSHRQDVDAFNMPVQWSDSTEFEAACSRWRQAQGSALRYFRPSWWKAKGLIQRHLAQQWPERAGQMVDGALLDAVDRRRCAAKGWQAADLLRERLGIAEVPLTAQSAGAMVDQVALACESALAIGQAEATLRSTGLWPVPTGSLGWRAWEQRVDAYLAANPASIAAAERLAALRSMLPKSSVAANSDALASVQRVLETLAPIYAARGALEAIGAWPALPSDTDASIPDLVAWDKRVDVLLRVLQTLADLKSAIHAVAPILPWFGVATTATRWEALVRDWQANARRLAESDRLLAQAGGIHRCAPELLRLLAAERDIRTEQWGEVILKTWAGQVVAQLDPAPAAALSERLGAEEEIFAAERYRAHAKASTQAIVELVLALQDEGSWLREPPAGKGARRNSVQATKEAMLREATKQRNLLPLRTFVRRYVSQGLLEALPVWLLSPETMAQLFPREPCFDVVILDEASQCTVEGGLPVLMRAKRVVVAGDEHQMPPSNFFKVATDDDEGPDAPEELPKDVLDAESLLVLARSRVAHAGLAWHYRCQQEELIAFSNHAIYEGTLKTIPSIMSRTAPAAIFWHPVEQAVYEDGANATEAMAVVKLLGQIMSRPSPPTIGVVTFNLAQRRAILDAIDQVRSDDPEFAASYGREAARERIDERPFVKNIENVQGDERDVIVFSLGHAPRQRLRRDGRSELYVPARFGPVGLRGGERRLNVAVSRAKREIHIVASFDPAMLSVANSRNEGPRLFKGFLEFAKAMSAGHRSEAERLLDLMRGTPRPKAGLRTDSGLPSFVPLKAQLLLALEREGYKCEMDVGASGFRVPLAIVDAENPHRYKAGLLFVEGGEEEDPVEAHLHVPEVLKQRGWVTLRVNARDWCRQPQATLAAVRRLIRN